MPPIFDVVSAPPILPATVGLLPTLGQRVQTGSGRWEGGYAFEPNGCLSGGVQGSACDADTAKTIDDFADPVRHVPNFAWVGGRCTSLGGIPRAEIGPRVRASLEASQGPKIERELWRGDNATGDSAANLFLAGGSPNFEDLTPGAGTSPGGYALAALQMFLAQCAEGGRGMIHATRATVDIWLREYLVEIQSGGTLITDAFGNWIVAGAGYDGSDPDGDVDTSGETAYAYATGLVDVKLGDIVLLPSLDAIEEAVSRTDNRVQWIAERVFGATWDGCCHAGVRVGLCETCCDPAGS
jgi:hypothetical protein